MLEIFRDGGDHLVFQLVRKVVDVAVMGIKGGLVDLGFLAKLFNGDALQVLMGPDLQKGIDDTPACFCDSYIHGACPLFCLFGDPQIRGS